MSRWGFSRCAIAAGVAFAASLPLGAADATPPASAATSESEALTRAQRDFDTIKATRNGTLLQARPDMPRVAIPEWQGAPVPVSRAAVKTPTPDAKSSTWLIDAMKKESASSESRKAGGEERGRDGRTEARLVGNERAGDSELNANELAAEPEARGSQARTDRTTSIQVVNPLTRYLGEWMTPQDYGLLKPGLTESLGQRSDLTRDAAAIDPTAIAAGLSFNVTGASPATATPPPPGLSAAASRENPYLQALNTPPLVVTAPPVRVATPAPVFSPPATMGATPANSVAPSRIPDFARPSNDEKYFKQLKRF